MTAKYFKNIYIKNIEYIKEEPQRQTTIIVGFIDDSYYIQTATNFKQKKESETSNKKEFNKILGSAFKLIKGSIL